MATIVIFIVFILWCAMLFNIPVFAEMNIFFGALTFIVGFFGKSPGSGLTMWLGIIMSLGACGAIVLMKKINRTL